MLPLADCRFKVLMTSLRKPRQMWKQKLRTHHPFWYVYTVLYYAILYYTVLYCTILNYTVLYYTILYCTILYYTILYYTILYYTVPGGTLSDTSMTRLSGVNFGELSLRSITSMVSLNTWKNRSGRTMATSSVTWQPGWPRQTRSRSKVKLVVSRQPDEELIEKKSLRATKCKKITVDVRQAVKNYSF